MNFNKKIILALSVLFLVWLPVWAHAAVSDEELQKEYGGKVLTLRQFYAGEHLHFDAAGKLIGAAETGPWTMDGQVRVKQIFVKHGTMRIRGQRLLLFYDPESKHLRDVWSIAKGEKAEYLFRKTTEGKWAMEPEETEIEVECGTAKPEMEDVIKTIHAVFLFPGEDLIQVVPDFWKGYFLRNAEGGIGMTREEASVARVDNGVSPPRNTYSPDPEYTQVARKMKYAGTLLLWFIVDETGTPQHIKVSKPLGMGLDEEAVKTVKTWKFDPAAKNGIPVPVQIGVEVSFRLY